MAGQPEGRTETDEFVAGAADSSPELLDERDRIPAGSEFRRGMILPLSALTMALAYRTSPWLLVGLAVPVWLLFLTIELRAEADQAVLRAVAQRTIDWPALSYLAAADRCSGRLSIPA